MNYKIKTPDELSDDEIQHILILWNISEWKEMKLTHFRNLFENSEFHFLFNSNDEILVVIRLNFDFVLEISGKQYSLAEAVGLVAGQEKKGYGSKLVQLFKKNMMQRNIETVGFCFADLRPFYQRCGIQILENKAKSIIEKTETGWITAEDDDILIFNISEENKEILLNLNSENNAYLITKEQYNEL